MTRFRRSLGYLAAVILILSSGAHSILGWKQLHQQVIDAHVPPDLIVALKLGWLWGGAAILAFGIITLVCLARGRDVLPVLVMGVIYAAYGVYALAESNFDPFFSIFIVPGILLMVAGWPSGRARAA